MKLGENNKKYSGLYIRFIFIMYLMSLKSYIEKVSKSSKKRVILKTSKRIFEFFFWELYDLLPCFEVIESRKNNLRPCLLFTDPEACDKEPQYSELTYKDFQQKVPGAG